MTSYKLGVSGVQSFGSRTGTESLAESGAFSTSAERVCASSPVAVSVTETGGMLGSADLTVTVDSPLGSPTSPTWNRATAGSIVVSIRNGPMCPFGRDSSQTVCQIPDVGVYQPTCFPVGKLGSVGSNARTVTTAGVFGLSASVMSASNGV